MANDKDDITTKFKVDISDLKKGITEANRQIKLANAEFKNASAGMDDWSKSSEGLESKLEQLEKVIKAQTSKVVAYSDELNTAQKYEEKAKESVNDLKEKLEEAKQTYGENSDEVQDYEKQLTQAEKALESMANQVNNLSVKLNNAEADVKSSKAQFEKYEQALQDVENQSEQTGHDIDDLGDNMHDAGQSAESGTDGFTTFKGALADLIADGVEYAIGKLGELKDAFLDLNNLDVDIDAMFSGTSMEANTDTYKSLATSLYNSGYGESASEVAKMMATAQQTGGILTGDLESVTKWLYTIEELYDEDPSEALRGLRNFSKAFGLTTTEAMDMMTQGYKEGLNYSHEFGDNLSEYSTYFAEAGYSASEYFEYLATGYENGAYNLDKLNDVVKEFSFTVGNDGGEVDDAVQIFGQHVQDVWQDFKDGKATTKDFFEAVIDDINNTSDTGEQMLKITTLLKSQGEDLGQSVVPNLNNIETSFDDCSDSAQELVDTKADSLEQQLESLGRTITTEIAQPLGEELTPYVEKLIKYISDHAPEIASFLKEDIIPMMDEWLDRVDRILPIIEDVYGIYKKIDKFKSSIEDKTGLDIDALIDSGNPLVQIGTMIDIALDDIEKIKEFFNGIGEYELANPFEGWSLGDILPDIELGFSDTFENVKTDSGKKFDDIKTDISDKFDGVKEDLGLTLDGAKLLIEEKLQPLAEFKEKWIDPILGGFSDMGEGISVIFDGLGQFAGYEFGQIKEYASTKLSEARDAVSEKWSDVSTWWQENVTDPIGQRWDSAVEYAYLKHDEIRTGISEKWSDIQIWWSENITTPISNEWQTVKDTTSEKLQEARDAVSEKFSDVQTWWEENVTGPISEKWNAVKTGFSDGIDAMKLKMSEMKQAITESITRPIKKAFNKVMESIETVINGALGAIMTGVNAVNSLPGVNVSWSYTGVSLPRLAKGGILKKGQVGLLEGNGTEAVVPLEKNKEWINKVAKDLRNELIISGGTVYGTGTTNTKNTFNQTIYSPKQPTRREIYRQTRNLLNLTKGV